MNSIILGRGQVGNAISANINGDIQLFDKGEWEHIKIKCDVLHICIPYSKQFIKITEHAINLFSPQILIIHSTVKPKTTKSIKFTKKLYSPVNGRHDDNFAENTRLYNKYFAGNESSFDFIIKNNIFKYKCAFIKCKPEQLEYSKIMCTNYMYWNLMYSNIIHDDCKKNGYDFRQVYTEWNINYNNGIEVLHHNWKRPVYTYVKGLPGGHCLRPNIHLYDNKISKILKQYEKEYV